MKLSRVFKFDCEPKRIDFVMILLGGCRKERTVVQCFPQQPNVFTSRGSDIHRSSFVCRICGLLHHPMYISSHLLPCKVLPAVSKYGNGRVRR